MWAANVSTTDSSLSPPSHERRRFAVGCALGKLWWPRHAAGRGHCASVAGTAASTASTASAATADDDDFDCECRRLVGVIVVDVVVSVVQHQLQQCRRRVGGGRCRHLWVSTSGEWRARGGGGTREEGESERKSGERDVARRRVHSLLELMCYLFRCLDSSCVCVSPSTYSFSPLTHSMTRVCGAACVCVFSVCPWERRRDARVCGLDAWRARDARAWVREMTDAPLSAALSCSRFSPSHTLVCVCVPFSSLSRMARVNEEEEEEKAEREREARGERAQATATASLAVRRGAAFAPFLPPSRSLPPHRPLAHTNTQQQDGVQVYACGQRCRGRRARVVDDDGCDDECDHERDRPPSQGGGRQGDPRAAGERGEWEEEEEEHEEAKEEHEEEVAE